MSVESCSLENQPIKQNQTNNSKNKTKTQPNFDKKINILRKKTFSST